MTKNKYLKFFFGIMFISIILAGCYKQEPRKPISRSSGTFLKESITKNKELIAKEEALIDTIIKKNPDIEYISSSKGYWYYYESKADSLDTRIPIRGDVVTFNYEIKDLSGTLIYSFEELKPQTYYIDKENIMMGLRDGIKLMKKGEKISFLFPSHIAYGYHGDAKKIGPNQPIICTVTLNDIKTESEVNK